MDRQSQASSETVAPREVTSPPFVLTRAAIEGARGKLSRAPQAASLRGLRVGVAGGGCSGYHYVFDFAREVRPERDLVLDFDGVTVVVDRKSAELLRGAVLDWEQGLLRHGFVWRNPNAEASCGCGSSFSMRSAP